MKEKENIQKEILKDYIELFCIINNFETNQIIKKIEEGNENKITFGSKNLSMEFFLKKTTEINENDLYIIARDYSRIQFDYDVLILIINNMIVFVPLKSVNYPH